MGLAGGPGEPGRSQACQVFAIDSGGGGIKVIEVPLGIWII